MFLNVTQEMTDKWGWSFDTAIAYSKGNFDSFFLPEPAIPDSVTISPDYPGGSSKGAYDFSEIQDYSDLEYLQIEGTLGVRYQIKARSSLYGSVTWMMTDDVKPYVYGDLSGAVWYYALGMTSTF